MQKFQIVIYETSTGKRPVEDFIKGIADKKLKAKVLRDIELLSVSGNLLREPQSTMLTDGLFELRTKQGSNIARVIYFFVVGNKVILTNGFIKKTSKTPKREIEMALEYKKDFLNRFYRGDAL